MNAFARILDRFLGRRQQHQRVRVHVHRAMLAPQQQEAYVIAVSNDSLEPVTVSRVWVETPTTIAVLGKRLPATIEAGQRWETWIETRELPPAVSEREHVVGVALEDETLMADISEGPSPSRLPPS